MSDAHENPQDTEQRLLDYLPAPMAGREWFSGVEFNEVRDVAKSLTQARTEPELYHSRVQEARRLLESHTGRMIDISQNNPLVVEPQEVELLKYFVLEANSYVMSSVAFRHYRESGGTLNQRQLNAFLEKAGITRKRAMDGARLYGIAIPRNP